MSDILTTLKPHDPRPGDRPVMLYDGRTGYQFSGIRGRALLPAMEQALATRPQLTLACTQAGSPVLYWRGWTIKMIDGDGAPVLIDDQLYHSMFFVWEQLVYGEGEEEPDRHSVPEEEPEDLADTEEIRAMLIQLTRVEAGGYSSVSPSKGLRRVVGYKDELFSLIPNDAWEQLPPSDLQKR